MLEERVADTSTVQTAHPAVQIEAARFVMGTHVISTQIILGKSIRVSSTPWSSHCRFRKALCIHTASTIYAANVRHSSKADASCWRFHASCTSPGNTMSNASIHRALKNCQSSNAIPPVVQEWFQMTQGHPKPWLAKAGWQNGFRCTPCLNRIAANKCVASSMLASVGSMRTAGLADSIDNLPKSSHFFFRRRATATKCSCPIFALPLVVRHLFDHDDSFTGVQRVWPLVGLFNLRQTDALLHHCRLLFPQQHLGFWHTTM